MAFRVISHTPDINATGVYRNETIRIIFDRPINPRTVTWETISVNDKSSYSTVVGSLGTEWTSSGTVVEATFTPESNLLPDTSYVVYVFEKPNSVLAVDGSELQSTYTWEFTTGISVYDEDAGSGTIPSGESTTITSGNFYVTATSPKTTTPNLDLDLSSIDVTFNGDITTSLSDMSGYVTIEETPVLY